MDPERRANEEGKQAGRADFVAFLYILGGIPGIIAYIVIAMVLARFVNFPS